MTASAWTDERIDRLKTLWHEGWTAEQIAAELKNGLSRSAVLGKVYRLGLSAGRPERPAVRRPRREHVAKVAKPVAGSSGPVIAGPPAPDLPSGGFSILALRRGQCRWPYGDARSGVSFCGRPVGRGAFCVSHAEIGYRTPPGGACSLLALAGLT